MPSTPSRVRRRKTAALALMTATMVPGLAQIPALATSPSVASTDLQHVVDGLVATLGDTVPGLSDLDLRGRVLPTAAQRSAADRLGADGIMIWSYESVTDQTQHPPGHLQQIGLALTTLPAP